MYASHRERIKEQPEAIVILKEVESVCRYVFLNAVLKTQIGGFFPP